MRRLLISFLALTVVLLSVCTDVDPIPTQLPSTGPLTAEEAEADDPRFLFPLIELEDIKDGLRPGRCVSEYHHKERMYKRKIHQLQIPEHFLGSKEWRPFHYTVLLGDSLILNRVICMVPEGQEGIDWMMSQFRKAR